MLESLLRKVLRNVFGGGSDISAANPLEVHDPKVGSLISYEGTTTANGAGGGINLVCSDLTTKPDFDGNLIIITSGAYEGQARDINGVTTGGTVTPSRPFGGIIVSGTNFVIVGITTTPAEVAAIEAKLDSGVFGLAALKAVVDLILVDTGTTLPAALAIIAGYLDTEIAAILAAVDTEVAAIKAKTDFIPADITTQLDTNVPAIKTQTDKIAGKMLFSMDFWSDLKEEVVVTGAQSTIAIAGGNVVVADLPATATIVRAIVMFKFRMVENTYAGVNKLDAAAALPMQIDDVANTGWLTCIDFVDDAFTLAASSREGGDVIIGDNNVAARVDGNDTYDFQWLNAKADQNNIQFNDCQVGIRIWYSV